MSTYFCRRLCFWLRYVSALDDKVPPHMETVSSMLQGVHGARLFVKTANETPGGTAAERRFVATCAEAMTTFTECDEVQLTRHAFSAFTESRRVAFFMNELVVATLSFKLHFKYGTPLVYIQRRIWGAKLPQIDYKTSPDDDRNCNSCPRFGNNRSAMWDSRIDRELRLELRITPLPIAPTVHPSQMLALEACLQQLRHMCMRLPDDISDRVCKGSTPNFKVRSDVRVDNSILSSNTTARCANVRRLVEKGLECGNIVLQVEGAFWVYCQMPVPFREWDTADLEDDDGPSQHLPSFPEIDPHILEKMAAMLRHPNWHDDNSA